MSCVVHVEQGKSALDDDWCRQSGVPLPHRPKVRSLERVIYTRWILSPGRIQGAKWWPQTFVQVRLDSAQVVDVPVDGIAGLGRAAQGVVRIRPELVIDVRLEWLARQETVQVLLKYPYAARIQNSVAGFTAVRTILQPCQRDSTYRLEPALLPLFPQQYR